MRLTRGAVDSACNHGSGADVNLFRLTRIDPDTDEVAGFVVAAPDEPAARALPAQAHGCGSECRGHRERNGDVRPCVWQSEATASCERIGSATDGWTPCVVLRDHRAV